MIDVIASLLGMAGSAYNSNLEHIFQIVGLSLWLASDILMILWAWDKSAWVVAMMGFYCVTCCIGIYNRREALFR